MKANQVNILGAVYTIYDVRRGEEKSVDANFDAGGCDGYVDHTTREIILEEIESEPGAVANLEEYRNQRLRHEIIHAFLFESGLGVSSLGVDSWAKNEEMVDWLAFQFPKICKAFKEVGCL